MIGLHRHAATAARRQKPEIPIYGACGAPLRHEIEFAMRFDGITTDQEKEQKATKDE